VHVLCAATSSVCCLLRRMLLYTSFVQVSFSGRSCGSESLTMRQLKDRYGDAGAQKKAAWCQQQGLVEVDPQDPADEELWLYEIGTGPRSTSGWQSSSLQEVSGDHAQPRLLIGDSSSADPNEYAIEMEAAIVPRSIAKAKAKGKAKAKSMAKSAAERLAKLRDQIDTEIRTVRDIIEEVKLEPMADGPVRWMEAYLTEMEQIKTRSLHDEASTALHRIALCTLCSPAAFADRRCLLVMRPAGRTEGSTLHDGVRRTSAEQESGGGLSNP